MISRRKIMGIACSAALAAAIVLPPYALALGSGEGNYEVAISADVFKGGDQIISVEVPAMQPIVVETSITSGLVMGMDAGLAKITNKASSSAAVKIALDAIVDEPSASGDKLLGYIDMTFVGDKRVPIVEGSGQGAPLYSKIIPGETKDLAVHLQQQDANELVPAGEYTLVATLKVSLAS